MPDLKDEDLPVCGQVGVHPSVIGMVSAVQVSEAVRVLIGQQPKLSNKLLYVDIREFEFKVLDIPSLESCKVCGIKPDGEPAAVEDRFFEETCSRDGRRNFVISPRKRIDLNMRLLDTVVKDRQLPIKSSGPMGITFTKSGQITACMLKSGIMIAQTPPRLECDVKDEVLKIYRSILVDGLGLSQDILPDVD
jgi:adenylyltransferase/sulfurtransferase